MNWRQAALKIAQKGPSPQSLRAIRPYIQKKEPLEYWGVACSGGADSVYLLLWLWGHFFEKKKARGIVLHYDHRVRGNVAEEDAQWVKRLAETLNLECVVERSPRKHSLKSSEHTLRQERIQFFHRILQDRGATVLFTGHQAEDVAEWMLMRLARGSGTTGLGGLRPVQKFRESSVVHLRPLLEIRRKHLRERLQNCGVVWREDFTNQEEKYLRNALRKELLPIWEGVESRPLIKGVLRSRELLEEEDSALEASLSLWAKDIDWEGEAVQWTVLPPRGILRRAWFRWVRRQERGERLVNRGSAFIEKLLDVVSGNHPEFNLSISEGWKLHVKAGGWRLVKTSFPVLSKMEHPYPLTPESLLIMPGLGELQYRHVPPYECQRWFQEGFPDETQNHRKACIQLNQKEEGSALIYVKKVDLEESYHPMGRGHSHRLQYLFKKTQIPFEEREQQIGVYNQRGVLLWVPGFPPSVYYSIKDCNKSSFSLDFIPFTSKL